MTQRRKVFINLIFASVPVAGIITSQHWRKLEVQVAFAYVDWWGHQPRVRSPSCFRICGLVGTPATGTNLFFYNPKLKLNP